jgi:type VI secretion system secreted protein VgrG
MDGSQAIAAGAALSVFGFGAQHDRLIRMAFPQGDGPDPILLPNRLNAREEVSRCFRVEVELLSDDARIPLKAMMARMVTISVVREDGSLRYFNGYVTEFRFMRADGGFAFYRMVLEPWLALTKLRKDNVSFHGKSVIELTELTFARYHQADWQPYIVDEFPRMTCANQYDETDYNHLHRRWEASGLMYHYEHRADGHTLWLYDRSDLVRPVDPTGIDDSGEIPFRDKAGSLEDDGIREWSPVRRIGSGQTTLASFDYKNPVVLRATAESFNDQGDVDPYEIYENTGSYGFRTRDAGEKLAYQRMGERDANTQYFEARGNDRTAQPGRFFKLGGHFSAELQAPKRGEPAKPSIRNRHYLILSVDHKASNNYQAGPGAPSHYENTFRCVRKDIQWRPGRNYNSQPRTYPGIQTAIVVGAAGAEIHTDGYGRVKVQFHWDRLGKYDENSSPWLRVMSSGAGSRFGEIRLPRVGEEVAVVYLDGNIDHPVILGALYNRTHLPPWQLPEQQALTGLRSRELQGCEGSRRGNHLILDDTAGKIQAQLKSDHQCSQLSLGHISRIEDTQGRKDLRGEGWELRTDGHGVARAAKGLLITTETRQAAQGPIKDMDETLRRLATAFEQHRLLAEIAQKNGAHEADGNQSEVASILQSQNKAIEGPASKGNQFPELAKPHLVLASAAGIVTTTADDTHIASDGHTAITTGKSLSLATGASLFSSIRNTFRLFVQKAGMKMVAAAGDIDVQALSDNIKLLAKLEISHSANRITISAKEEIVINGGGSYAKFTAGGIEHGTNGTFIPHAASHSLPTAKSMGVPEVSPLSFLAAGHNVDELEQYFSFEDENGKPISGYSYRIDSTEQKLIEGVLDESGRTPGFPIDKELTHTSWISRR